MFRHPRPQNDPRLTIIVPILNELEGVTLLLKHLEFWRQRGVEIIVVDGGSDDKSDDAIRAHGFRVIRSARGRAIQMNAGVRASTTPFLLFLHADTQLPANAETRVITQLAASRFAWGRFDVRISGRSRALPIISGMMNIRSRLSAIATGDQALFMTRALYDEVGGFPEQPLMEDVEMSKRLKHITRPACLREKVVTSGRRWDEHGTWPTILLMWQLRWAYWRGVPAEQLASRYR